MLAVAVGTAALVAINSFTDNLRESVAREARALLGADLALSSASPFSPAAEALLAEVRAATAPPAEVARVVSFGAMALRPGGGATRLVRVQAVDPGYPYYGAIETSPPGECARLAETGGAIADASLLVALGARTGRRDRPRRGALRPARDPRQRARGRGHGQRLRAARRHPRAPASSRPPC